MICFVSGERISKDISESNLWTIFDIFFFSLALTWEHIGLKVLNDISSESTHYVTLDSRPKINVYS